MLLFRSITAGLLGACVFLLAQLGGPDITVPAAERCASRAIAHERATERASPATTSPRSPRALGVVDVAHGVSASQVLSLISLHRGERIVAIDDREVANQLVAGIEIADAVRDGTRFLDLSIESDHAPARRLVVLLH